VSYRIQGIVSPIPFPDCPEGFSDVDPNSLPIPTPEQSAAALVALHEVHCPGVARVIAIPAELPALEDAPEGDKTLLQTWKRALIWLATLDRVRGMGDYALQWFKLQFRRLERDLSQGESPRSTPSVVETPPPVVPQIRDADEIETTIESPQSPEYLIRLAENLGLSSREIEEAAPAELARIVFFLTRQALTLVRERTEAGPQLGISAPLAIEQASTGLACLPNAIQLSTNPCENLPDSLPARVGANDAETAEGDPPLSQFQYDILQSLRTAKATDAEKRVTASQIAEKVGGTATEQSCKAPLADLKHRGLVDSQTGRGGGSWLTPRGRDLINRLRPVRTP
jgi:hypothetical protein